MLKSIGAHLLGILFICLCLMMGISAGEASSNAPSLANIKEFHSDFIYHQQRLAMGQLELPTGKIYFPWSERERIGSKFSHAGIMPSSRPVKEQIRMNGSHPIEQVKDLKAINVVKQRDVVYEEVQRGDTESKGSINSMDIQVIGNKQSDQSREGWNKNSADNIEKLVDDAFTSSKNGVYSEKSGSAHGKQSLGNNLNIEVSGISVSAINTVPGGNAVANSNIIIKPVQIIVSPSEVGEKIK